MNVSPEHLDCTNRNILRVFCLICIDLSLKDIGVVSESITGLINDHSIVHSELIMCPNVQLNWLYGVAISCGNVAISCGNVAITIALSHVRPCSVMWSMSSYTERKREMAIFIIQGWQKMMEHKEIVYDWTESLKTKMDWIKYVGNLLVYHL